MAIYGIGAHYGRVNDMTQDFIDQECACVGWDENESPALHRALNSLKIGDLIYIKSCPPSIGLIIKAVGIVKNNVARNFAGLGFGVEVKWLWQGNDRVPFKDKYNVHQNTFYEEFVPVVHDFILSKIN